MTTAAAPTRPPVRLAIGNPRQFWAGILFALIGGLALAGAQHYPLGTAARIGPGYFPTCLAVLLIALGAAAALRGLQMREATGVGPWPLLPLLFVTLGVTAFAFLIEPAGLVGAGGALLVLCCYGRLLRRPIETAILAVSLLLFVALLFVTFLQLPINLF